MARHLKSLFALLALGLAAACSGGGDDVSGNRALAELLEWIPRTPDTIVQLHLIDLQTLREAGGVAPPADRTDFDQWMAYTDALQAASGFERFEPHVLNLNVRYESTHENFAKYLHTSFADVDLIAESGIPPVVFYVAGGQFEASLAQATLLECAGCVLPTDEYSYEEVGYLGWGDEYEQLLRLRRGPPMLDGLGRGGRLFMTDEIAVRTESNRAMEAVLEAGELHGIRALADVDDFALAAKLLDEEDAWFATLSRNTLGPEFWVEYGDFVGVADSRDRLVALWNPEPGAPLLRRHDLFAAGSVATGDENYLVVVLIHDNNDDAKANVDLLRRRIDETESGISGLPWREEITTAEIRADGRALIARLHGLDTWSFYNLGDPLTLHE